MKIERLSENQIRCTLYKSDLADKEMLLTELAYGTDKAKELFKEMMEQASDELGFEVDNIPLMIEAIPVSPECLILIVTKVEDPEELDTRFSRFTQPLLDEEDDTDNGDEIETVFDHNDNTSTDSLIEALGNLAENLSALGGSRMSKKTKNAVKKLDSGKDIFRIYAFKTLDEVILSSKLIKDVYVSHNSLYKNPQDSRFYLYLTKNKNNDGEFTRICNIVSEYGTRIKSTYATPNYMDEHFKVIIETDAVQKLAEI
ncbi:MAG: adaptor protein MecA [Lachnospiraceae bacterium]|nr:adaptor protein MecA [Lachnospiraceae bacterium]